MLISRFPNNWLDISWTRIQLGKATEKTKQTGWQLAVFIIATKSKGDNPEKLYFSISLSHTQTHAHTPIGFPTFSHPPSVRLRLHIIIVYKYNTRQSRVEAKSLLAPCQMENVSVCLLLLLCSRCLTPRELCVSLPLLNFFLSSFKLTLCGVNKFERFMHKLLILHINNKARERRYVKSSSHRVALFIERCTRVESWSHPRD